MYFRFIKRTDLWGDGKISGWGGLWVPLMLLRHFISLRSHFVWRLYNSSTLLADTGVSFLVPFDPKIPLFVLISLLGIHTHRIVSEDSLSSPSTRQSQSQGNDLVLQSDPLCGLTAGGEACELDCDRHPDESVYSDPTCLRDCGQYPACFQQLYKDYETAGTAWWSLMEQWLDLIKLE